MADTITIPGAVDLHVHFREPGTNKAETIRSGSRAALMGGYVLVADMPNNPGNPTWSAEKIAEKHSLIKKTAFIPMAVYAGSQPESDNLAEFAAMAPKAIGLKLYGAATTGNLIDYEPRDFSKIVAAWHQIAPTKPIMLHSGRGNLAGFINIIARQNQHPLHICHLFSVEHSRLAAQAKKKGLPVTSAVCPHHLFKSTHHTATEGWFSRMQPPPLHQDEAEELFKMLVDGEIDILETDHAPHSEQAKWAAENANPEGIHDLQHLTCFGVPGIEFALPLLFYQMKRGRISLERIIEACCAKPAEIIGTKISKQTKVTWKMEEYRIGHDYPKGLSGSGWTPYLNNLAVGKVEKVWLAGKLIYHTGTAIKSGRVVSARGEVI
jgi:dihydroorotase